VALEGRFIQPMQKVRGNRDADPSYRAVYDFADKRSASSPTRTCPTSITPRRPLRPLAVDKPYRPLVGFDANYSDHYLVNTKGRHAQEDPEQARRRRHLVRRRQVPPLSPGQALARLECRGRQDDRLTTKLPVKFWSEDADTPSTPPSFGQAGWTADDKHVVLYDQYDVWLLDADGRGAKNLTGGAGRKNRTQYRIVRLGEPERALDMQKPLLLKAESLDTRDQGFYRLYPDGRLVNLITAARALACRSRRRTPTFSFSPAPRSTTPRTSWSRPPISAS